MAQIFNIVIISRNSADFSDKFYNWQIFQINLDVNLKIYVKINLKNLAEFLKYFKKMRRNLHYFCALILDF
jgi:hypothetical protein